MFAGERWVNDICGSNTKFSKAIKKYGFNSFEHIIIAEDLDHNAASNMEQKLIMEYDAYHNGYNSTLGGDGGGFIGHHHSKESIKKSTKNGSKNGMFGKKRPQYVKDAVAKAHSKKIYQYDKNYNLICIFESGYDVHRILGYDNSYISKRCRDNHEGYRFFWSYTPIILPPTTTE